MSRPDLEMLERDLRAARTVFDEVEVSPDAWQRNQRLVAGAASDDRRSLLTAVAAGVAVLLVIAAGWLALGGRDRAGDVPGSGGSGDSDSSSGELTDPVTVSRIDLPDGTVTLEAGIGKGQEKIGEPSLCYRLDETTSDGGSASGAGGCTSKVDRADLPGVTVDYLTGGTGEIWTTMTGAVDGRTARLTMWQADGTSHDVQLHDLVGSDLRGFGFLGNGPVSTRPVRLVAWADEAGTQVLESVDVVRQFDMDWLPGEKPDCGSVGQVPDVRLPAGRDRPAVRVRASFTDAEVTVGEGGEGSVCLPMNRVAMTAPVSPGWVVVVVAPEVAAVERGPSTREELEAARNVVGTTMWRAFLWPVADGGGDIVFTDRSGQELVRAPTAGLQP